jgi:RecA/RadA recombinase
MSPVDISTLDSDLALIRDRREESVRRGDEAIPVDRVPLPSPSLMRITSGGIPLGRITRLWGDPGTGKTLLSLMIIAACQQLRTARFPAGLETAYWNVEGVWDDNHGKRIGVDTKRMLLEEIILIEDIARELEILLKSCHAHVIDSASAAICIDELATDAEDWTRAIDARAWKRAIRRIDNAMDHDENIVVFIDHSSRDQTTKREYALGGKSLEYRSSMSLHFKKGGWLYYHPERGYLEKDEKIAGETGKALSGVKPEPDGVEVFINVNKSRVCRPHRSATLRLDLNTFRFDTDFELMSAATFFDADGNQAHRSRQPAIAQRTGAKSAWYTILGNDKDKVQGEPAIRRRINEDEELAATIERAMLAGN